MSPNSPSLGSVRVRRWLQVRQDLVGRPLVTRIDLDDLAVGADDDRPQVVGDVAGIVRRAGDEYAEPPAELLDGVRIPGEESPAIQIGVELARMLLEHGRCV